MGTVKLARFAEWSAANANGAFTALQTLYEANANAMQLIAGGTLAADTALIDMPFTPGAYRMLRLTGYFYKTTAGATDIAGLQANYDSSFLYDSNRIWAYSGGLQRIPHTGWWNHEFVSPIATTPPWTIDLWIFPVSTGFTLIGSGTSEGAVKYAGVYSNGPVSSLQLVNASFLSGSLATIYAAGGRYRLDGFVL